MPGKAADAVCAAHYAAEAVRRMMRPGVKVCVARVPSTHMLPLIAYLWLINICVTVAGLRTNQYH
jgi:hypothetical protein